MILNFNAYMQIYTIFFINIKKKEKSLIMYISLLLYV